MYERKNAGDPPQDEVKKAVEGMMTAFEEFKKTNDARLDAIEKKGTVDPLVTEKLNKIETSLQQFEGINQKLVLADQQAKKAAEDAKEAKERGERIELKLNRPRGGGGDDRGEAKQKVNTWARAVINAATIGIPNLPPEQQKALQDVADEYKSLSIANDTTGGYLAPSEYVMEIIKGVTEISPARSIVRTRTTSNKSIQVPKRTGQFAAQRVAEQGMRAESTGLSWGMVEINAPEMYALIDISAQNLEDSAFDLESEIRMEAVDQFAVKEGSEFVSGAGVLECEGILQNASVAETNSGSATAVAADGLLSLFYGIKTAYARNAVWIMNRQTIGSIRKLKDQQNQYLWMPGLAQGVPNSINGAPYVEMPDMPNEGAGTYPVAIGDFRRGYTLLDRVAMTMLRDPYTQATQGNIRFMFRRRVGGQVVLAEAMRKLKCST